jgi:hypothetical protein
MLMKGNEISGSDLPNWDSVEEVYVLAARTYQKSQFIAEELAQVRLGQQASRSALRAESVSLYNVLRNAAMYGLVEWYGGNEFGIAVLPEDSEDLWSSIFGARSQVLRTKVVEKLEEEKEIRPTHTEMETEKQDDKEYIITYVGPETTRRSVDSFVFRVWDPKKHEGIVLQAWGHNIKVGKRIAEELQRSEEEATFKYSLVTDNIYRSERGLVGEYHFRVEMV